MKNKHTNIKKIIIITLVIALTILIYFNLKQPKLKEVSYNEINQTKQNSNIQEKKKTKEIEFEIVDVDYNLEQKQLFKITENLNNDLKEKIDLDLTNKLFILINNNLIKNKESQIIIKNIEKTDREFIIRYKYSKPKINKVIGEKYQKRNQVIIFSINELKNNKNKFIFLNENNNKRIVLTYTKIPKKKKNPNFINIKPVIDYEGKKVAYLSNRNFGWELYVYDLENNKNKLIVPIKYTFNENSKKNSELQFYWKDENNILLDDIKDLYRISMINNVIYPITTNSYAKQETNLIYDKNTKGYYFVEGENGNYINIFYLKKHEKYKNRLLNVKKGTIKEMQIIDNEKQIVYILYKKEINKPTYELRLFDVENKTDNLIYKATFLKDICIDNKNKEIYFIKSDSINNRYNDIYKIKLNGTSLRKITDFGNEKYENLKYFNGNLFFLRNKDLNNSELWVKSNDKFRKIADYIVRNEYSISPYANKIVYTKQDYSIVLYDIDKNEETLIISSSLSEVK